MTPPYCSSVELFLPDFKLSKQALYFGVFAAIVHRDKSIHPFIHQGNT